MTQKPKGAAGRYDALVEVLAETLLELLAGVSDPIENDRDDDDVNSPASRTRP